MDQEAELKEVMTEGVIAIDQEATVIEAAQKLRDEHVRGLVVIENEEAVGVLVARDIVYQVTAARRNPEETKVKEVMSTDLIVAEEDEPLDEVAMAMSRNSISRIPVVRGDMLVGIVTQSDIMRAWPGFAEIMEEEVELEAEAEPRTESRSGVCENCENFSEDLQKVDGLWVCPNCR